eukprot:5311382-Amphidinium_carterae.1
MAKAVQRSFYHPIAVGKSHDKLLANVPSEHVANARGYSWSSEAFIMQSFVQESVTSEAGSYQHFSNRSATNLGTFCTTWYYKIHPPNEVWRKWKEGKIKTRVKTTPKWCQSCSQSPFRHVHVRSGSMALSWMRQVERDLALHVPDFPLLNIAGWGTKAKSEECRWVPRPELVMPGPWFRPTDEKEFLGDIQIPDGITFVATSPRTGGGKVVHSDRVRQVYTEDVGHGH